MGPNVNINNVLAKFSGQASGPVLNAIQTASAKTGVDFAYLVQQAKAESSFNPTAKAKTSSASGLYQFIESTWLDTVERHGAKHGVETDGLSRSQILALRNDPDIASNMAAEFALENKRYLEDNWGGDIGATEMYLAHFMGAGGAASFLNAKDEAPLSPAADIFPKAAAANRNVFYDSKTGEPRTLAAVYEFFDKKFQIKKTLPDSKAEPIPSSPVFIENTRERSAYENMLLAELTKRGIGLPNQDTGMKNPFDFSFENRTMPTFGLMQSPVTLMMLAESDMPYERAKQDAQNYGGNDQKKSKDIFI